MGLWTSLNICSRLGPGMTLVTMTRTPVLVSSQSGVEADYQAVMTGLTDSRAYWDYTAGKCGKASRHGSGRAQCGL